MLSFTGSCFGLHYSLTFYYKGPHRQSACVSRASRERYFHAIKKISFIVNQCVITHRTGASSVSRAFLARCSRVTRQNQIKSDFIACRVRIAWKSREYDVGNKVFPNTVTVPTIRKIVILFRNSIFFNCKK